MCVTTDTVHEACRHVISITPPCFARRHPGIPFTRCKRTSILAAPSTLCPSCAAVFNEAHIDSFSGARLANQFRRRENYAGVLIPSLGPDGIRMMDRDGNLFDRMIPRGSSWFTETGGDREGEASGAHPRRQLMRFRELEFLRDRPETRPPRSPRGPETPRQRERRGSTREPEERGRQRTSPESPPPTRERRGSRDPQPPSEPRGSRDPRPPTSRRESRGPQPPTSRGESRDPQPPRSLEVSLTPRPPRERRGSRDPQPPTSRRESRGPEPPYHPRDSLDRSLPRRPRSPEGLQAPRRLRWAGNRREPIDPRDPQYAQFPNDWRNPELLRAPRRWGDHPEDKNRNSNLF
ncbi:hypothetical protein V499_01263 [Pseudogymnoascus sp. VKM F-103]|nr:hypothetical protein V499_01263 [Pseudogymnoascus sp. VKM F-103]